MITKIFDLTGKTIVITGGAGHLGAAMSEALVAFGADLFIVGKNEQKNIDYAQTLQKKYPVNHCEGRQMDIADQASIEDTFSYIYQKQQKIDVIINNSSYGCMGKVENMSEAEWCSGIDGTINGVFRVTKEALKYMLPKKHGNIINIASMYGMVAPDPAIYGNSGYDNPANYGAGKAAIIQFTKYIAANYAKSGIRANSISPGPFPDKVVQQNSVFIKDLCKKNPAGRIGCPEDLQGILICLCADATSYLTGQNIAVDGGWTAW